MQDLQGVPSIIGGLGLSLATAQKAFNQDYLEGMERIIALTKVVLGDVPPLAADDASNAGYLETRKALLIQQFAAIDGNGVLSAITLANYDDATKEAIEKAVSAAITKAKEKALTLLKEPGDIIITQIQGETFENLKPDAVVWKDGDQGLLAAALNKSYLLAIQEADRQTKAALYPLFQTFQQTLQDFIEATAPSRYQFTETTFTVKMDLAQSLDVAGSGTVGFGYGGIALNLSLAAAYGIDYRAAAEVKTTLHAIPADKTLLKPLLEQADKLSSRAINLPTPATVDQKLMDTVRELTKKLTGEETKEPQPANQ